MQRASLRAVVGGSILIAAAGLASLGLAGDGAGPHIAPEQTAGGKGQCAAMELDGTPILVRDAAPKGMTRDYVGCGKALEAGLRPLLCPRGRGRQPFLYRISDNPPARRSILCK